MFIPDPDESDWSITSEKSSQKKSTKKSVFPKKVILAITTHGSIPVSKGTHRILRVPENMKITKINATSYGICNMLHPTSVDDYIKELNKIIPSIMKSNDMDEYYETMQPVIKFLVKEEQQKIIPQLQKTSHIKYKERYQNMEYIYQRKNELSYKISVFNSNDDLINKVYERSSEDKITINDFVIKALNVVGQPDLMNILSTKSSYKGKDGKDETEEKIKLNIIIEYLKSKGVEEVVIIDSSCSNLFDEETDTWLSEREIRRIRRSNLLSPITTKKRTHVASPDERPTKKRKTSIRGHYVGYGGKKRSKKNKTKKVKKVKKY